MRTIFNSKPCACCGRRLPQHTRAKTSYCGIKCRQFVGTLRKLMRLNSRKERAQ